MGGILANRILLLCLVSNVQKCTFQWRDIDTYAGSVGVFSCLADLLSLVGVTPNASLDGGQGSEGDLGMEELLGELGEAFGSQGFQAGDEGWVPGGRAAPAVVLAPGPESFVTGKEFLSRSIGENFYVPIMSGFNIGKHSHYAEQQQADNQSNLSGPDWERKETEIKNEQ